MQKINKIFANCLLVSDIEKSSEFYEKILGFEINSHDGGFMDFKLGETSFAIFQKSDATAMFPAKYMKTGGSVVLAFQVENLADFCNFLSQKGIKLFEGPKETAWGQKVAYFLDPDENIIEISEV